MRFMGGLRRVMPWTYATFLVGGLSLAGIFPLAGFWSKDEILAHALGESGGVSQLVFWLALAAVFMTAFYMFRALFMTFEGRFRGGAAADPNAAPEGADVHLAESPKSMVAPMVVLGGASVVAGFLLNPTIGLGVIPAHWLTDFLGEHAADFNYTLAAVSTLTALAGVGLAYLMYWSQRVSARRVGEVMWPAYVLLSRKYYFDEMYEVYVVTRLFNGYLARFLDWADKSVVDGTVRQVDRLGRNVGRPIAQVQSGQLQGYGVAISVGVLVMFGVYLFLR
jgi:NADH-quinone oxidoreductase subunit L